MNKPSPTESFVLKQGKQKGEFELAGVLDFTTVPEIMKQNPVFSETTVDTINIDLGGITKSNSAGIALLIEWLRQARNNNKAIYFQNIPDQLLEIAKISDLESILPTSS